MRLIFDPIWDSLHVFVYNEIPFSFDESSASKDAEQKTNKIFDFDISLVGLTHVTFCDKSAEF